MKKYNILTILFLGCSTSTHKPLIPEYTPPKMEQVIEIREPLPEGAEKAVALLKDEICPWDGVLLTERLATKYRLIRAERDKLRTVLEIERDAFSQKHKLMTQAVTDMYERAKESENWWVRNKGILGAVGGFIVAAGTYILLTFAVTGVQ